MIPSGEATTRFTLHLSAREAKAIRAYITDVMKTAEAHPYIGMAGEYREIPQEESFAAIRDFRGTLEKIVSADAQARLAVRDMDK